MTKAMIIEAMKNGAEIKGSAKWSRSSEAYSYNITIDGEKVRYHSAMAAIKALGENPRFSETRCNSYRLVGGIVEHKTW